MRNHRLRIIGGTWRGRHIHFHPSPGLRPSGDRIRETVFNWLAAYTPGANCLDAFAGSGVLGLEALSRGAAQVIFLEKNLRTLKQLQQSLSELGAGPNAKAKQANSIRWLQQTAQHPFDLVFVDPPFHQNLVLPCLKHLQQWRWLKPGALVYVECETTLKLEKKLDHQWIVHRIKQTKELTYALLQTAKT